MPLVTAAIVGGALAVGGAAASGIGASQKASAQRKAQKKGIERTRAFTEQFTQESKDLKERKLNILGESENVFDRLGGFIFGDTNTLESLRESQEEFAALAAGESSGFLQEIESIVKSSLASTSGLPTGAFENLSARNLLNFRSQGLQNALSITERISGLGSSLINTEFGINDQDFETRLKLRENELNTVNALQLGVASTRGTGAAAFGNVLTTAGNAVLGIGNAKQSQQNQQQANLPSLTAQQQAASAPTNQAVPVFSTPTFTPGGTRTPITSNVTPALPAGSSLAASDLLLPTSSPPVAPIFIGLGDPNQRYTSIE